MAYGMQYANAVLRAALPHFGYRERGSAVAEQPPPSQGVAMGPKWKRPSSWMFLTSNVGCVRTRSEGVTLVPRYSFMPLTLLLIVVLVPCYSSTPSHRLCSCSS